MASPRCKPWLYLASGYGIHLPCVLVKPILYRQPPMDHCGNQVTHHQIYAVIIISAMKCALDWGYSISIIPPLWLVIAQGLLVLPPDVPARLVLSNHGFILFLRMGCIVIPIKPAWGIPYVQSTPNLYHSLIYSESSYQNPLNQQCLMAKSQFKPYLQTNPLSSG